MEPPSNAQRKHVTYLSVAEEMECLWVKRIHIGKASTSCFLQMNIQAQFRAQLRVPLEAIHLKSYSCALSEEICIPQNE